jgi:sporulation protein YlmC with PRC-barrel domain
MIKSKKINLTVVAATVYVMAVGLTASAQEASTDKPLTSSSANTTAPGNPQVVSRASQLIGTSVENQDGQRLGRITDVVVNFDNNQVSYCVMSIKHGAFAKTRYLAVPLGAFVPSGDGSHLILNASRDNLAGAAGIGRNELPSTIVPVWGAEPGQPEELPPVVVFAPTTTAPEVKPPAIEIVPDAAMGPPAVWQRPNDPMNSLTAAVNFGYPIK